MRMLCNCLRHVWSRPTRDPSALSMSDTVQTRKGPAIGYEGCATTEIEADMTCQTCQERPTYFELSRRRVVKKLKYYCADVRAASKEQARLVFTEVHHAVGKS